MDGDGRAELLVGAPGVDAGGAAFVVFSTRASSKAVTLGSDAGMRLDGVNGSRAGHALAGVADVNGDGLGDLAVGAPAFGAGNRLIGAATSSSAARPPRTCRWPISAPAGYAVRASAADGFLGLAVAGLGDVTGDGKPDVAFGAPASDATNAHSRLGLRDRGQGRAEPVDVDSAVRVDGATAGDRLAPRSRPSRT